MLGKFLMTALLSLTVVSSLKLPSYITPCRPKDADFKSCVLKSTKEAIPSILKGDPKYEIPKLNPLLLPSVKLSPGSSLNLSFKDMIVKGLETVVISDAQIDLQKRFWSLTAKLDRVELNGQYNMDGKILVVPIKGQGWSNVTIEKPTFIYEFHYDLSTRNGQEHMMLKNPKIESKITKAYFRFDNLFERDQKLGVEINKFLNENWMNVYNDIRPAVEETVSAVITNIVSNFAKKVPFKEVFLS